VGGGEAQFDPVLVTPTIPLASIRDETEALVTRDSDELVRFVEKGAGQGVLNDEQRSILRPLRQRREASFSRILFRESKRVLFVMRTAEDGRALFLDTTDDDVLVPTVTLISRVLGVQGGNESERRVWYRELARRVGTARRATGIVVFPNGNAIAVLVGEESVPGNAGDVQIVAVTHFFKAGTYKPDAWGPELHAGGGVRTDKANGHDGVSILDTLKAGRGVPSPPPTVTF